MPRSAARAHGRGERARMIQIEKNVPIPNGAKPGPKYPYWEMEVGDSFLFPSAAKIGSARSATCRIAKQLGRKFTVRKTEKGLRCWRVE